MQRGRAQGGGRSRPAEDLVCGVASVDAALARRGDRLRRLLVRADRAAVMGEVLADMARRRLPYRLVDDAELERAAGTDRHQGVLAVFEARPPLVAAEVVAALQAKARFVVVYLDGVGNPHNLGAIARTAAHFGVDLLIQRKTSASASTSAAVWRVAEGGLEALPMLPLATPAAWLAHLRERTGCRLLATAADGAVPLWSAPAAGSVVWMLGEERAGLSADVLAIADGRVHVPGTGAVESLNVAATAAILLAETSRQRVGAPAERNAPTPGPGSRQADWPRRTPGVKRPTSRAR